MPWSCLPSFCVPYHQNTILDFLLQSQVTTLKHLNSCFCTPLLFLLFFHLQKYLLWLDILILYIDHKSQAYIWVIKLFLQFFPKSYKRARKVDFGYMSGLYNKIKMINMKIDYNLSSFGYFAFFVGVTLFHVVGIANITEKSKIKNLREDTSWKNQLILKICSDYK